MVVTAFATPSPLWYMTRGTGATALILLTVSIALGVANLQRLDVDGVPRFVMALVHRNVALLAVAFLLIHIVTAALDPFAPIRLIDAVIPFISVYRPIWLGLGAVAFDLLLAVTVTSLLRGRIGPRVWRLTHWFAYAMWPLAVVHGLGTGSDAKHVWLLLLVAGCVMVVLVAVAVRIWVGWPDHLGARISSSAAAVGLPVALLLWLPGGPLASNWAARAGTPPTLLHSGSTSSSSAATAPARTAGTVTGPFTAAVRGTVTQGEASGGLTEVHIALTVPGQSLDYLSVRLYGNSISGGGLSMTTSRVALGTSADPEMYAGQVTALTGTDISASVAAGSTRLNLVVQLQIDQGSGQASGHVTVTPG